MWLIVGLGNPGEEYAKTRHNIGFRCLDELARRHGFAVGGKRAKARIAESQVAGQRVVLAWPFTFMNNIGQAVVGLVQWYKINPAQELLVVYDDLDLPFGTLRLRASGSAGTHNGMRSIVSLFGSQAFARLRIGIGAVPPGWDAAKYVLSRFTREEEEQLAAIRTRAADAIELVIREGLPAAMNRTNAPTPAQKPKQAQPDGPAEPT